MSTSPNTAVAAILKALNRTDLGDGEREVLAVQLEDLADWVRSSDGFGAVVHKRGPSWAPSYTVAPRKGL